ncbi:YppG family protein [Virgibacillus sp. DJP39]|uniref:YppG family protein n=1 Tax=Virgibacillus sp. DJP39 TaxID=3409790 RepID=UPI003BB558B9
MFNRPNYYQRPYNYNPNYPPYSNQQWHNPARPPYQQTPYQYYAKPKQPADWYNFSQPNQYNYGQPYKQPQKGWLTYFHDKNGEVDFDKMISSVGQVATTFQQISPMVKQFGSIMKNFK